MEQEPDGLLNVAGGVLCYFPLLSAVSYDEFGLRDPDLEIVSCGSATLAVVWQGA